MSPDKIIAEITAFVQTNVPGAIAAGIILLFLLVKKPKLFFTLLFICLAGLGVMMIFEKLSSTGLSDKSFQSLKDFK